MSRTSYTVLSLCLLGLACCGAIYCMNFDWWGGPQGRGDPTRYGIGFIVCCGIAGWTYVKIGDFVSKEKS